LGRIGVAQIYFTILWTGMEVGEEFTRTWLWFTVMLSWLRCISFFRYFRSTRYLIRIIIEIIKGIIPFLAIFISFILAQSFSYMALKGEGFFDSW
jgi:hypothetical protein